MTSFMSSQPSTRPSLLLRLRDSRDHEAWVEFVAIYEPVVYRLLRRHALQDADAREVMQEVFLAVNKSIDRWDAQRGTFRCWLRTVTRNLFINWLAQRNRRVVATGGTDFLRLLDQVPAVSAAESIVFDKEVRRAMFRRAAALVERQVRPLTWRAFWETCVVGASPAAAAQKLDMQIGTVRVAKCRVIARLRTALENMEHHP
jgi:RNA polymerase sigma factor (sigma-70 family)